MASVRDLNNKISSLQNMKKVMSAMNMIASTKFGRLISKQIALIDFRDVLAVVRNALAERLSQDAGFFVMGNVDSTKSHIIILTADRGLCGSHNSSVLKALIQLVGKLSDEARAIDITAIGNKGANFCRKKELPIFHSIETSEKTLHDNDISRIAQTAVDRFVKGEIGELYVIYNRFVSALSQKATVEKILPLSVDDENKVPVETTSDLTGKVLASSALPLLVFYQLKVALANSYLSEHGARMTAMENASNNSEDLIERYGAVRNRARQTAITNEISEIVSGKEAMKK